MSAPAWWTVMLLGMAGVALAIWDLGPGVLGIVVWVICFYVGAPRTSLPVRAQEESSPR